MTNVKPLIVFDADSVLVDWFKGYVSFLKSKGFCIRHLKKYIGKTIFVSLEEMTKNSCKDFNNALMKEFQASGFLSKLDMFQKDGQKQLEKLSQDFDFAVVTCIGETEELIKQRNENLNALYGNVFIDIKCIDYGKSKEHPLKELSKQREIAAFIDDREKHLEEARLAGIENTILMTRGVVVEKSTSERHNVISCLSEVEKLVTVTA